jgi:hypothetical protein
VLPAPPAEVELAPPALLELVLVLVVSVLAVELVELVPPAVVVPPVVPIPVPPALVLPRVLPALLPPEPPSSLQPSAIEARVAALEERNVLRSMVRGAVMLRSSSEGCALRRWIQPTPT